MTQAVQHHGSQARSHRNVDNHANNPSNIHMPSGARHLAKQTNSKRLKKGRETAEEYRKGEGFLGMGAICGDGDLTMHGLCTLTLITQSHSSTPVPTTPLKELGARSCVPSEGVPPDGYLKRGALRDYLGSLAAHSWGAKCWMFTPARLDSMCGGGFRAAQLAPPLLPSSIGNNQTAVGHQWASQLGAGPLSGEALKESGGHGEMGDSRVWRVTELS
ncbi:hypothetical protein Baya_12469 [Bagarius yarrelli]|uniref:Uncharacterized protein n=1 Tax=Bagarius yarrelli TaxID=175774 RepID=A0A556V398_BAGYA|nr:hypothetical protein Baya_12469 [Bagarius yarrelli]